MRWLNPGEDFPPIDTADADGMLAVGGDLTWQRLHRAYSVGTFPWCNPADPLIWWSPDPRYVIYPDEVRVRRSMRPLLNQRRFRVSYDEAFADVMRACMTSPRQGRQVGSWITPALMEAYVALHEQGFAHSLEVWTHDGQLAGGLYGVALGRVFAGESMFARVSNASKYGFIHLARDLARHGYWAIDCQLPNPHLLTLGATAISRREFGRMLERSAREPTQRGSWTGRLADQ